VIRAVDYFAGAGGWSTGATQAGVRVAAAVNHWRVAVDTHAANHPATVHFCQDAALLDPRDLPPHELLLASPACQGHSRARGTDKPHHDKSRATAWCVVNAVEVARPRYLAVENVPEFRAWGLYEFWFAALRALGYALTETALDASEFGVPQERARLFVTGVRGKRAPRIASPHRAPVPFESALDATAGGWSDVRKPGRAAATLARITASRRLYGPRFLLPYYSAARHGRPVSRPLGTVTTRDRYALVDGDKMRMLTVDEYRAAMGFPAGYVLTGTRAERVMQLGNACVPAVTRSVVSQLLGGAA